MKQFLILGLLLSSTSVFASKLANIDTLSNSALDAAAKSVISLEFVSHSALKKVLVLKANANSPQGMREKTVAQSLHTLCPFFDEGVGLSLVAKNAASAKNTVIEFTESSYLENADKQLATLLAAIKNANKEETVEVYSGAVAGNNTYGNVLGFYDVKNDEVAVFANTNCGRDD